MPQARTFLTLLATIFALLAFSWQMTFCFAEHAGLIACHEQSCGTETPASDETSSHCCHFSSTAVLLEEPPALPLARSGEFPYHALHHGVPEAPVREIDHPPQLPS